MKNADSARALFRFGIVADIQYSRERQWKKRRYRESLEKLSLCLEAWKEEELSLAVQLGDLIDGPGNRDGNQRDLDEVLGSLEAFDGDWIHVIGNHDLTLPRPLFSALLGIEQSWRSSVIEGWRLIVLDSLDFGLCGREEGSVEFDDALRWLKSHPIEERPCARKWNGGFGPEQLRWLRGQLGSATAEGERVAIFCHNPVLEEAADARHLAWNHEEALAILDDFGCVAAWFSGHHHEGGYALRRGVHHLGIAAMVEAPPDSNAWGIVEVFDDRLMVRGYGSVRARELAIIED